MLCFKSFYLGHYLLFKEDLWINGRMNVKTPGIDNCYMDIGIYIAGIMMDIGFWRVKRKTAC